MSYIPFGCGHNAPGKQCHHLWFVACPQHFANLMTAAMQLSIDETRTPEFYAVLQHLAADRYLGPAFYTWMGIIAGHTDPHGDLTPSRLDTDPREVPADIAHVPGLVETACRAAVARDPDNLQAVLDIVSDGELPATLSFMMSAAATAAIIAAAADAVTTHHLRSYLLLGSQTSTGWGAAVLPELVTMVMEHDRGNPAGHSDDHGPVVQAFRRLVDVGGTGGEAAVPPLPTSVDMLTRVLAQTVDPDVIVLDSSRTAIVDVGTATSQNTPREIMASVWAIRASRAYANAADPRQATENMKLIVRSYGDAFSFSADVITAATMMIGANMVSGVDSGTSLG